MTTTRKPRRDYIYVAYRIEDPEHSQNLGDFTIRRTRRQQIENYGTWEDSFHYHYASEDYPVGEYEFDRRGRIVNRSALIPISHGSRIYNECIRAVERLIAEENATDEENTP